MDCPGLVYTCGYSIPEWDQKYKLWQTWAYDRIHYSWKIDKGKFLFQSSELRTFTLNLLTGCYRQYQHYVGCYI